MFGPNTYISHNSKIDFSHRDKSFIKLFERVTNKFSDKFDLDDYDILFIPGSGTIGIESVFYSSKQPIKVIGEEGIFKAKWELFSKIYSRDKANKSEIELFCQLETSESAVFEKENCIVDAISSFPYYKLPKTSNIFITCTNKQLGGFPGLAIVCVKKNYWDHLKNSKEFSYLNLSRYLESHSINQTPHTTPTQIFEHFEFVIDNFQIEKLRNKIVNNSQKIAEAIGSQNIIGELTCPVISIEKKNISDQLANKYNLYGLRTNNPYYQIFTYACKDEDYDAFTSDLKNENSSL